MSDERENGSVLVPGQRVEHFQVLRELGRGGMGEVYLARDTRLGRRVALKVVRPEALGSVDALARFLFEARTTARFNHPHIVTVYAVGEVEGRPYVALEYLEGETLRERLDRDRPGMAEALRMALAIGEALQEAHGHKVLHRDLKPQNVIIGRDGRLRVLDFGLAKLQRSADAPAPKETTSVVPEVPVTGPEAMAVTQGIVDATTAKGLEDTVAASSSALAAPLSKAAPAAPAQEDDSLWSAEGGESFASRGGLAGTPAYMAPEQWEGRTAAEGTDVWALGVVLFEMLVARRPYQEKNLTAQALAVCAEEAAPRLELFREDVPADLSDLLAACLAKDPSARPAAAEVVRRLELLLSRAHGVTNAEESPFRGLLPFGEQQAHLFFGREAEIAGAAERLRRQTVLPIIGPSGAGKSSFALAGLLPRLREQGPWVALSLRPGRDPFGVLAARVLAAERLARGERSLSDPAVAAELSLTAPPTLEESAQTDGRSVEAYAAELRRAPQRLALALTRLAERQRSQVLLFIDQLEEVHTLVSDPEERRAFLEAICAAADDVEAPVRVVLTLREEFLARLAVSPTVAQALTGVLVLGSPGPGALREILTRPVEALGYRYESGESGEQGLVERMLKEVRGEVAALPLLQFAGARLWEQRDRSQRLLTEAAYEEMAGVAGALAQHADRTLAGLAPHELSLARALLLRLVTPEGTRRVLARGELLEGLEVAAEGVLARLAEARLVVARRALGGDEEVADDSEVELVHESLIASWSRLRRWLEEGREDLRFLAEIGQAAKLWQDRGARPEEAWTGEALADAERNVARLDVAELPPRVRLFLEIGAQVESEHRARERRRRRLRLGFAVGIPLSLFLIASVVALLIAQEQRRTERQRQEAEAQRAAVQRESAEAALGRGDLLEARARLRASLTTRDSTLGRALWQRLKDQPQLWRRRLGARIYAFDLSPDAKRLALAAGDGSIYLVDALTSRLVRVLRGHGDQVFAVAFAPDGTLVSGAWDGELRRWSKSGAASQVLAHLPVAISSLAFSPDGSLLAVGSWANEIGIYAMPTGRRVAALKGHSARVDALAFAPTGLRLASAGHDRTVRLWTLGADGHLQGEATVLRGHGAAVYALAFSADGKRLASGSADLGIRLWDVPKRRLQRLLIGHEGFVWSLAFSPDGRRLASGSWDETVRLWDVKTGRQRRLLRAHREVVSALRFDPAGSTLFSASRDRSAAAWHVPEDARGPARALDGRMTQAAGEGHRGGVSALAFTADGAVLATAGQEGAIRLWDVASGRQRAVLRGHEGAVQALAYLPDGKLASAGADGVLRLWDTSRRRLLRGLRGHRGAIWDLAVEPQGRWLASAGSDRTLRFWDPQSGASLRVLHHDGEVLSVALAPPAKVATGGKAEPAILASAGAAGKVRFWRESGELIAVLPGHGRVVTDLVFADARTLLSTDLGGRVRLYRAADPRHWGAASSKVLLELPRGRVYGLAVSRDGRLAALPSSDGIVRLLDLKSEQQRLLRGHRAEVNVAAFSPRGKLLATAADDRSTRLWRVADGRPFWRAPVLLSKPPRVFTHAGWARLDVAAPAAGPTGAFGRALEAARLAEVRDGVACVLTFDGRAQLWRRGAAKAAADREEPQVRRVVALGSGGCALLTGQGRVVHFSERGGRLLVDGGATALARAPSGALLVADATGVGAYVDQAGVTKGRETLYARKEAQAGGAGPTALTRLRDTLALGYRDGTVELIELSTRRRRAGFALEDAPSSPVLRLLAGPRQTLVVGFADGSLGVWDARNGDTLFRRHLHGAVEHLLLEGRRLHAVSALGGHVSIGLEALTLDYCALLRRVWRAIPVVWQQGHAVQALPPATHRCHQVAPTAQRPLR